MRDSYSSIIIYHAAWPLIKLKLNPGCQGRRIEVQVLNSCVTVHLAVIWITLVL